MREKAARKLKTGQIAIEFWDIWPRNMPDWTLPDEMHQRAVALRGARAYDGVARTEYGDCAAVSPDAAPDDY
jgi:hypothetical protein